MLGTILSARYTEMNKTNKINILYSSMGNR